MKHLVSYGAGFILLLLMANACTGITPSAAAEHLANGLKTGDYAAVADNLASATDATDAEKHNDKQVFIKYLQHKREVDFAKQGGIQTYTIIGEMVAPDESKAIVRIRYTFHNHSTAEELIPLVKAGELWRYVLPEKSDIW